MKKAFTLIEVNLAMLIMAGGILSIVGLYAFAFRENRQSREDVIATAMADSVDAVSDAVSADRPITSAFANSSFSGPAAKRSTVSRIRSLSVAI